MGWGEGEVTNDVFIGARAFCLVRANCNALMPPNPTCTYKQHDKCTNQEFSYTFIYVQGVH